MTRTKLMDRQLPVYTKGEEVFNMVTHIVGASLGGVALVLCIIKAALEHNGYALASAIVYGVSMIVLYTMSSIYHGISPKHDTAKKVFQIIDHCTIFILIAGSYTPVLLCNLRTADPLWAWILFGVVWGVSVIGIILNAIDLKSFKKLSMFLYLALGWCIVFKLNLLIETVHPTGIILLVLGGIAYSIGTIFYSMQKKQKYMHSIWHLWILLGSILHFICIFVYVI